MPHALPSRKVQELALLLLLFLLLYSVSFLLNFFPFASLTNGQLGELVDIIKTTKGEADKLIIKLKNQNAGKFNKSKYPGLNAKYPDCVVIEKVSNQYTLRKKGGEVSNTATLFQFPVKLAHAITAHKIQGQTIPYPVKVVLDINSVF